MEEAFCAGKQRSGPDCLNLERLKQPGPGCDRAKGRAPSQTKRQARFCQTAPFILASARRSTKIPLFRRRALRFGSDRKRPRTKLGFPFCANLIGGTQWLFLFLTLRLGGNLLFPKVLHVRDLQLIACPPNESTAVAIISILNQAQDQTVTNKDHRNQADQEIWRGPVC